ncbi:MAG: DUF3368 domain-containing protein, partial [Myxococcales bacterium]|nr:DUF3368 domain-containing protein [Myxococcales bacterium]
MIHAVWGMLATRGAEAVLDDGAARRCADELKVPVRGTLGLVLFARAQGCLPRARPVVEALVDAGMYLRTDLVDKALALVGEERAAGGVAIASGPATPAASKPALGVCTGLGRSPPPDPDLVTGTHRPLGDFPASALSGYARETVASRAARMQPPAEFEYHDAEAVRRWRRCSSHRVAAAFWRSLAVRWRVVAADLSDAVWG